MSNEKILEVENNSDIQEVPSGEPKDVGVEKQDSSTEKVVSFKEYKVAKEESEAKKQDSDKNIKQGGGKVSGGLGYPLDEEENKETQDSNAETDKVVNINESKSWRRSLGLKKAA